MNPHRPGAAAVGLIGVAVALVAASSWSPSRPSARAAVQVAAAGRTELAAACLTADPYYAVAVLSDSADVSEDAPAVVAIGGPLGDSDDPVVLATRAQVGDVYGLGYDAARRQLYAAAYLRAGGAHGPGGPGQIYQIDLDTGAVVQWAAVDAGPDRHGEADGGASRVGYTGLGDLDVSEDGAELYVTNLLARRIERLSLPDGRYLGSFRHGGHDLSFQRDLHPFGLAVRDGLVYHGEVNGQDTEPARGPSRIVVYRSRPDGTQMEELVSAFWDYPRGVPWSRWSGAGGVDVPIVADIAVGEEGDLVLGLRDRQVDADPSCVWSGACAAGSSVGDLLPARFDADGLLHVTTSPAWFQDSDAGGVDTSFGALAKAPGIDLFVSPSRSVEPGAATGEIRAYWFALGSGARLKGAAIGTGSQAAAGRGAVPGDVEVLCSGVDESGGAAAGTATSAHAAAATASAEADLRQRATQRSMIATQMAPTMAARATGAAATAAGLAPTLAAEEPTRTAGAPSARATMTAAAPRVAAAAHAGTEMARLAAAATPIRPARATAAARALRAVEDSCGSGNPYMATTRFVPRQDGAGRVYDKSWLKDQSAIIVFNDTAADDMTRHYEIAQEPQVGATFGVAYDLARRQLYVGAYLKRLSAFGPLGPGGIYRYDMATGRALPFARLEAGADPHRLTGATFDEASSGLVSTLGLGDLELWQEGNELLVVNLYDRLIYRLSVPDGRVLGAFPNGAAAEPWADTAVPFALAVRGGWVYHGVTDPAVGREPDASPTGYVYRSRPDGSEMTEVARLSFGYGRAPAWGPWGAAATMPGAGEPLLTDIEFREDGDLVLGIRDRLGDSQVLVAGGGDIVLTSRLGGRWFPMPDPELYNDNIRHAESSWGTLASLPWLDEVISTVIDPVQIYSGGIAWFSNRDGSWTRLESIYAGANITFGKASGLGDIEALCEALPPPPTETPTATVAPTGTPTATATATATVTCTPTRALWTVYLPIARREPCIPEEKHADVVLVLDMSTSMYRRTLSDRTKHEAAIAAARLFVDELDLAPGPTGGYDRVAVVGFNDTAWTAAELGNDRATIERGLDGMLARIAEGTRLDLALREGLAAIRRADRGAANPPVLILLTDGLPNRVPTPVPSGSQADAVIAVGTEVKGAGVRVFTVGLGLADDVLDALLSTVASQPSDYYFAPDGEDLAAIYRQIAGRIVECPNR